MKSKLVAISLALICILNLSACGENKPQRYESQFLNLFDTVTQIIGYTDTKEEFEDVYPAFGSTAKAEGFFEAASTFFQIAEIEHTHQERFQKIAEMLENGTYYSREEQGRWICTNCGYIHDGKQAPSVCPVCRHEKGYFLPYEYAPYKGAGK